MSIKLRELIRAVRSAKTAAEERAVITKECALCRSAFSERDSKHRHRNVAKLLYIHMLGYPTHFAQMECLKLIASPKFPEKRIGYLGLMLLLDERQKVLMLVTNSLKQDFSNKNPFVVGLSLAAIGNVASSDISRDLSNEVEGFFRHANPYLRKKACCAAMRCIRKVPELIEDFVGGVTSLLSDRNHSVQLAAVSLIVEMIKIEPDMAEQFRKLVRTITRMLTQVRSQVSDYDGAGVSDPFLQVKLIHLLRLLGTGDSEASEFMNEVLAQVAIGTEASKNPGYAVLYECVMTIMSIESEGGLRTVAINILGRFLVNQNNNNIRYVALSTLCKLVNRDTQAIQRHRNTIVDCLKDADISIRRRALDLIYALVTKNNVVALVKELLNYLALTTGDKEFKTDLTEKICVVINRFAPNKQWHIDTILEVLTTAGKYTQPHVVTDLIALISQSEDHLAYSVHKLYTCLASKFKSSLLALGFVGVWAIGEYGELLTTQEGASAANASQEDDNSDSKFLPIPEGKVVKLLQSLCTQGDTQLKQYILNALIKLASRFTASDAAIQDVISTFTGSLDVELQQRAVEYTALSSADHAPFRAKVLARMPKYETKAKQVESGSDSSDSDGSDSDSDSSDDEKQPAAAATAPAAPAAAAPAPVNLMDIFGGGGGVETAAPGTAPTQPVVAPSQPVDMMASIFGDVMAPAATPTPQQPVSTNNVMDMFGMVAPQPAPVPVQAPGIPSQIVHTSPVIKIEFGYSTSGEGPAFTIETKATFFNVGTAPLANFEFQVAVPKFLRLTMQPASSNMIPVGGSATQSFSLLNTLHGTKKPVIKTRINYVVNGQQLNEQATITAFP